MIVKNWTQVYKSLAVWLPILASAGYTVLKDTAAAGVIPDAALPVVVGITGVLGWVIKQRSITK